MPPRNKRTVVSDDEDDDDGESDVQSASGSSDNDDDSEDDYEDEDDDFAQVPTKKNAASQKQKGGNAPALSKQEKLPKAAVKPQNLPKAAAEMQPENKKQKLSPSSMGSSSGEAATAPLSVATAPVAALMPAPVMSGVPVVTPIAAAKPATAAKPTATAKPAAPAKPVTAAKPAATAKPAAAPKPAPAMPAQALPTTAEEAVLLYANQLNAPFNAQGVTDHLKGAISKAQVRCLTLHTSHPLHPPKAHRSPCNSSCGLHCSRAYFRSKCFRWGGVVGPDRRG